MRPKSLSTEARMASLKRNAKATIGLRARDAPGGGHPDTAET